MLLKSGFVLLLVTVVQVFAVDDDVRPEYLESIYQRVGAGSANSRIVSGWPAEPGQHPHQAALRQVGANGGVTGCGGSFVHREWVMTAAHCTAGRVTIVVRGGVVSLTDPEYIFETTEYYNYPTFDNNRPLEVQINDISLVKLQRPVVYTERLKAIRIQSRADANRNYDGLILQASGHGRTWTNGPQPEILQWTYLRGVSNSACAATFVGGLIVDSTICARWFNVTSQSTCQGDSGGPLVYVNTKGKPILVGVTSFVAGGTWGCHSGLPAGFIRPGPFHSWFTDVTGIDFENLDEGSEEEPEEPEEPDSPEEGDDSDSSEEDDDDDNDIKQIMKRLEVGVKVKVRFNKYKIKKEIEKEKEIRKKQ